MNSNPATVVMVEVFRSKRFGLSRTKPYWEKHLYLRRRRLCINLQLWGQHKAQTLGKIRRKNNAPQSGDIWEWIHHSLFQTHDANPLLPIASIACSRAYIADTDNDSFGICPQAPINGETFSLSSTTDHCWGCPPPAGYYSFKHGLALWRGCCQSLLCFFSRIAAPALTGELVASSFCVTTKVSAMVIFSPSPSAILGAIFFSLKNCLACALAE